MSKKANLSAGLPFFEGEIPKARKLSILSDLRYFVCYHIHRNKN